MAVCERKCSHVLEFEKRAPPSNFNRVATGPECGCAIEPSLERQHCLGHPPLQCTAPGSQRKRPLGYGAVSCARQLDRLHPLPEPERTAWQYPVQRRDVHGPNPEVIVSIKMTNWTEAEPLDSLRG
jgi:hypothetical protein